MNITHRLAVWIGVAAIAYLPSAYALTPDTGPHNAKVTFDNSERFTDIQTRTIRSAKADQQVLDMIAKTFRDEAARVLPHGYLLDVNVTDIDLAGDRSLMPPAFSEYRILEDIYPPRIAFTYTVRDPTENIVARGSENLTDLDYLQTLQIPTSEYTQDGAYTRNLIKNWVRGPLGKAISSVAK